MKASLGGDANAYEKLLTTLRPLLAAYSRKVLLRIGKFDTATADDLVQEILIAMHQKRHTYDQTRPFLPWIFAIARYKVIDYARHERRRPAGFSLHEVEAALATPVFSDPTTGADLDVLMGSLSPKARQVLTLAKLDGLSIAETAAIAQMSPGAVKVAIHRSLRALKAQFKKTEEP